ncbi:MAG: hypothetical protein ACE5NG_18920 [bacterium]
MMKSLPKKNEAIFIAVIVAALLLVVAIVANNISNAINPPRASGPRIDVKKVMKEIKKAGLEPREAKYYEIIKRGEKNEEGKSR